jgi:cell division protein FtsN
MAALKAGKSIKSVSDVILTDFEKPADQSSSVKNRRANFGREIYDRQTSGKAQPAEGAAKEPYALQFGAFSKQENARKRANELKKKDIDTDIEKIGSFWKVRSGERYATAAEASTARSRLSEKKINSVIVEV